MRHNGNRGRGRTHNACRWRANRNDYVQLLFNQFRRQWCQTSRIAVCNSRNEVDLLWHPKTGGAQSIQKCSNARARSCYGTGIEESDLLDRRDLLRTRDKWPSRSRAAEKRDELAAAHMAPRNTLCHLSNL